MNVRRLLHDLSKEKIADIQVLSGTMLFGIGFLGQRVLFMEGMSIFYCNAARFFLSFILLLLLFPLVPKKINERKDDQDEIALLFVRDDALVEEKQPWMKFIPCLDYKILIWSSILGTINFIASAVQQDAVSNTTAGKVAFISGFSVILVPVFQFFILRHHTNSEIENNKLISPVSKSLFPAPQTNSEPKEQINKAMIVAILMSVIGLYFMSGTNIHEIKPGLGELLSLTACVFWTFHIIYTDISTIHVDVFPMVMLQFLIVAVLSFITALIVERGKYSWDHLSLFFPWLLFLSTTEGLGFLLIALGQKHCSPTSVALFTTLEGLFASIAQYVFLNEKLSTNECMGAVLMITATYVSKNTAINLWLSKDRDSNFLGTPNKSSIK